MPFSSKDPDLYDEFHSYGDKSKPERFEFPDPPETIPEWARKDALEWRNLCNFDIEVRAEEISGKEVEIRYVDLPESVWGFHIARNGRVRLCVNSSLPYVWQRFALFHELYHLISHPAGEAFWRNTFHPLSRFESEADMFAWAAVSQNFSEMSEFQ